MEILNFADYDSLIIPEPLWREIKDIKCCKTCKHWIKHQKWDAPLCEVWHNYEEISEGEGKNVLDCWERRDV